MNTKTEAPSAKQYNFPITPEIFWKGFTNALLHSWSSEVEAKYANNKEWTAFMTSVLEDVGATLGCHVDREYWPRVDISYFDKSAPEEWMEWSREAAIEIEAGADWTQELCKLIEINAGLKVLIAYPPGSEKEYKQVFERLPEIYRSRKYVTNQCRFVFVFGDAMDFKGFSAFTFDGDVVEEIGNYNPNCPT